MHRDRHSAAEAGFSGSRGEGAVKVTGKKEGEPHFTASEYDLYPEVRHPKFRTTPKRKLQTIACRIAFYCKLPLLLDVR